ncbi:hypothetical protein A4A49_19873 [Nicotiana attenuata]|uniref:Uncharacterized protein n=1 Tax=Nicotiana attenuata TaxID=49451 RepID=A0A1J6IFZ8_NICAT|nr:hypothetical protein A4A49_19873 [Nicotiana attenuata]
MVEKQFTKTIRIFQCDGGGEFNSTAFVEHLDNCGEVLNRSSLIGVGDQPTADVNAPSPSDQLTLESLFDALDETAEPAPTTDHNAEPAESPLAAVPTETDDLMTAESEEPNSSAQDSASSDSNVFLVYDPQGI